jgi:DNA-binding CsgD family transcriptional regulator
VRALALLAWRTTHRSPQHLALRREVSSQALDLTQQLRLPSRQVEAAVMLAVDALESADRPRFDEALSVARWVAERDGNPRLVWHALTLAAGAAHLDGDTETAANLRTRAREVGESVQVPGWMGADLMLFGEELLERRDINDIAATVTNIPDDNPTLVAPLGRIMVAHGHALIGDTDAAERNLRRSLRGLDEEASYLLVATRGAQVAVLLGLHDVIDDLIEVLTPWADHVAVDSNAWWCDGPVSLALAELHHATGSTSRAQQLLGPAEAVALTMGDVRAINRARTLRTAIGDHDTSPATDVQLTDREWQVLKLVAQGQTNPEIAATLAYSPSTIRNDLTAIYQKLGVRGRSEAASRANDLGIA